MPDKDITNSGELKGLKTQADDALNRAMAAIIFDDLEGTIREFSNAVTAANKAVHAAAGNVNR